MLTLVLNLANTLFNQNKPLKFYYDDLEELKCKILEISEQQNYSTPSFPCDDGNYRGDTIYKLSKTLNVRVYVKKDDIIAFEQNIENANLSEKFFTINSLYDKTYKNYKIESYSKDTNANVLNATHYNIVLKKVILITSLVENYKNSTKSAYGGTIQSGSKNPQQITKQSTAYQGLKKLGF
ncbi:TPA: hypothetical protein RTG66_001561 [Campylobacter jejuni]|nr:hypothetical protein [Campylobacter jejuni]